MSKVLTQSFIHLRSALTSPFSGGWPDWGTLTWSGAEEATNVCGPEADVRRGAWEATSPQVGLLVWKPWPALRLRPPPGVKPRKRPTFLRPWHTFKVWAKWRSPSGPNLRPIQWLRNKILGRIACPLPYPIEISNKKAFIRILGLWDMFTIVFHFTFK